MTMTDSLAIQDGLHAFLLCDPSWTITDLLWTAYPVAVGAIPQRRALFVTLAHAVKILGEFSFHVTRTAPAFLAIPFRILRQTAREHRSVVSRTAVTLQVSTLGILRTFSEIRSWWPSGEVGGWAGGGVGGSGAEGGGGLGENAIIKIRIHAAAKR